MHKIAVIGCGIVGLSTAVAIQEELKTLAKITIFTEELSPNTTGDVAAGLWCPHLLQDTNIEDIVKWSKATHDHFVDLWKKGYAAEAGICLQVVTLVTQKDDYEYPEWASVPFGSQPLSVEQLKRLNRQYKKNYKAGINFVTVSCEPSKFLPFLQEKFISRGGVIQIKKITSFKEVSNYDIVVNCTGLYSRILAEDDQVIPIRGQIVRVIAPWQKHTFVDMDEDDDVIANYDTVVLGGTGQMGNYNKEPVNSDTKKILKGCYNLVPGLKSAPIKKHLVGLRPGRSQVRLELEIKRINNKNVKIVHNYGHAGSGVTLSHGCALATTDLVKQALAISHGSKL